MTIFRPHDDIPTVASQEAKRNAAFRYVAILTPPDIREGILDGRDIDTSLENFIATIRQLIALNYQHVPPGSDNPKIIYLHDYGVFQGYAYNLTDLHQKIVKVREKVSQAFLSLGSEFVVLEQSIDASQGSKKAVWAHPEGLADLMVKCTEIGMKDIKPLPRPENSHIAHEYETNALVHYGPRSQFTRLTFAPDLTAETTIFEELPPGKYTLSELLSFLRDAMIGGYNLHIHSIVNGDIKNSNMFTTPSHGMIADLTPNILEGIPLQTYNPTEGKNQRTTQSTSVYDETSYYPYSLSEVLSPATDIFSFAMAFLEILSRDKRFWKDQLMYEQAFIYSPDAAKAEKCFFEYIEKFVTHNTYLRKVAPPLKKRIIALIQSMVAYKRHTRPPLNLAISEMQAIIHELSSAGL